jgi:hypothetical protein
VSSSSFPKNKFPPTNTSLWNAARAWIELEVLSKLFNVPYTKVERNWLAKVFEDIFDFIF